jgi:hypothetical protein
LAEKVTVFLEEFLLKFATGGWACAFVGRA